MIMEMETRVQFLAKGVYVLHGVNTLGNNSPPSYG